MDAPKRGRPPSPDPRTHRLELRLSDAEVEALTRAAGDEPLSSWVRDAALAQARRVTKRRR